MAPPDDAPPLVRLARWSEWWLAPRWRALVTWMVLLELGQAVLDGVGIPKLLELMKWPLNFFDQVLPFRLPSAVRQTVFVVNIYILIVWFEPWTLRLSLRRGAAWLALRVAAYCVTVLVIRPTDLNFAATQLLAATLATLVLHGWRSRPWMCIVAAALSFTTGELTQNLPYHSPRWLVAIAWALPYAALLLYGTRLLRPEERARGGAAG